MTKRRGVLPVDHVVASPVDGFQLASVGLNFTIQHFVLLSFGLNRKFPITKSIN